jgi:hypothetical protein
MANSYGTTTALSGNANSLANGAFASLGEIDFGAAPPHLCFVEVSLQASTTTTGNQGVQVFARSSIDGTNFSDSGSADNERNLTRIGFVSLKNTSAHRSRAFEISQCFGGGLPTKVEIVVKNDCGVALAATGQVGQYRTETLG